MYGVVYRVVNTVNGHFYIGQTKMSLSRRWSKHCSDARSGAGWVLAAAIRKYGEAAFTKEVLAQAPCKDDLNALEVSLIAQLKPQYNACAGGGGLGSPSEEVRKKISDAGRGKKKSEQFKALVSERQTGRACPEETRLRIQKALAGRAVRKAPVRQEEIDALVARNKARRKHEPRHDLQALYVERGAVTRREKIALAAQHDYEIGARTRLFGGLNPMFGRAPSEELKAALSKKFSGAGNPYYGKTHSDETRAKMRAAHLARPTVECPHCHKKGRAHAMKRWHFENCKAKP